MEDSEVKPHKALETSDEITRQSQIHSNISNVLESWDPLRPIYFGTELNGAITKLHIKEHRTPRPVRHVLSQKKSCSSLNMQRKEPLINREDDTILHNSRQKHPGDWQLGSHKLLPHKQERWKGFKLWDQRKGKDHLTLKEPNYLNSVPETTMDLYYLF